MIAFFRSQIGRARTERKGSGKHSFSRGGRSGKTVGFPGRFVPGPRHHTFVYARERLPVAGTVLSGILLSVIR
jgi:hypothetical protein